MVDAGVKSGAGAGHMKWQNSGGRVPLGELRGKIVNFSDQIQEPTAGLTPELRKGSVRTPFGRPPAVKDRTGII